MDKREFAKEQITILIEKFNEQHDFFKSSNYNETQTRRDFIDPFFKALGWDMENEKQDLETYRDVKHEDKIKINGHSKSPDYSFNIKGKRKFFVEAKRPSVPIKENPEPALQVRSYGWNGKLSISLVTDFEEFAIYDCTKKPKKTDKALTKRLKYIYYKNYIKEFDFIYDTFSYESVLNNSFNKFIKENINLKAAEPVDKEFLKSLENWRTYLATNIALNNQELDEENINFAVQQTIDRIVFLRVCEDRKIEQEGNLQRCIKQGNLYSNLFYYFKIADQKYNSGLFDFKKDIITEKIVVENKIIKTIITELFEGGYNFAVIPVEILGYAYEQFLGKVIRLTAAHHAKIEEKIEVRKSGGVYYTPDYIVQYIVENTVGKLIDHKTPEQISEIKILDPACGSGSFLLGAYQYLLDYHLKYYNQLRIKNYELRNLKEIKNLPLTPNGDLSSKEKKRILLNNIHGVDIDTQAVEVTKLSLLLKALEGETEASIQTSLQIFNERVLPNIETNIQCGNSLIAADFYKDGIFITPKEQRKVNVFDWVESFQSIFKKGGFNVIIGNPPWSSKMPNEYSNYICNKYAITTINLNLFAPFILTSLSILNPNGLLGLLIPKVFIKNTSYTEIRKKIIEKYELQEIIDFGKFPEVASDCVCPIISYPTKNETTKIKQLDKNLMINDKGTIPKDIYKRNPVYAFSYDIDTDKQILIDKIMESSCKLSTIASIKRGIELGQKANIVECTHCKSWNEAGEKYYNQRKLKICKKCKKAISVNKLMSISNNQSSEFYAKKSIAGRDISRYSINSYNFIPKELKGIDYKNEIFETDRLFLKRIATKPECVFVSKNDNILAFNTVYSVYNVKNYDCKFILGVFNSDLMSFYYETVYNLGMNLTTQITIEYLKELPIPKIDFKSKSEFDIYEQIIKLVESRISLQEQLNNEKLETNKTQINRLIKFTETQINELVCKIYKIEPFEIQLNAK